MKNYRGLTKYRLFPLKRRGVLAVNGLFVLAWVYTLYFAKAIFMPIVVAILLNFLLAPVVRIFKKIHIPESISALFVILVFLGGFGYGFYSFSGPANDWLSNKGAETMITATAKIELFKKPIEKTVRELFNIRQQIEKTTKISEEPGTTVTLKSPAILPAHIFTSTSEFFMQIILIFFILYFLLASGDFFLKKTVEILPTLKDKKEAIIISREIKNEITNFLLIKTWTGLGLAVVLTVAMYFLKMPLPILWGVLAALLEFIPYVGVLVGTIICAITSLMVFDTVHQILLPPLCFYVITSITGNFFVPLIMSRSLTLHPVIIFIAVIFGGWIWGVVGALIAIPLLSILKIFCNYIKSMQSLGKFLGE